MILFSLKLSLNDAFRRLLLKEFQLSIFLAMDALDNTRADRSIPLSASVRLSMHFLEQVTENHCVILLVVL